MPLDLFDLHGNRKYLTQSERTLFENTARQSGRELRTFCLLLLYTGCRISEALNVEMRNIDFTGKAVVYRTLKKRKGKVVYRAVPLPDYFLDELNLVHNLKSQKKKDKNIWAWSRATASRKIDNIMKEAKIYGIQACPKGLRHGFAVACLEKGIPLNLVQKWLGHSSITTTAIYANALGAEERNIASRLWL